MLPVGDADRSVSAGTREALELLERRLTSVPANSASPSVLLLAKVMPKISVNCGMTLLKIGHMVC